MFREAVIRLTVWYLLLIMGLSISFSAVLYREYARQMNVGEQRLANLLQGSIFPGRPMRELRAFTVARSEQIEELKDKVQQRLVGFNILILLVGGAISYILARRTLQPIEESVEAQSRFISDASHELRTPLTAVRSEVEVALRDSKLTLADSKKLHRSTLEEIARLESLSAGLLTLARQDGLRARVLVSCSLLEAAKAAVKRLAAAAKERQIGVSVEGGDVAVKGDKWALEELLTILLDNALKYSPAGSRVRVALVTRPQHAELRVTDQGSGIAASDLPHIFERFYRADRSRSSSQVPGYGLGLAIAKKIVEMHRGNIHVNSQLGEGSTFVVRLPRS